MAKIRFLVENLKIHTLPHIFIEFFWKFDFNEKMEFLDILADFGWFFENFGPGFTFSAHICSNSSINNCSDSSRSGSSNVNSTIEISVKLH